MYMYLIDHYDTCANNWRTRLIGHCNRCSYWQHAPTCRYDPDEIYVARMQGVLAFFRNVLFDTSRSIVCYSVEYYIIRLWPVYTRFCLLSHSTDRCRGTFCSGARQIGRIRVRGRGTRYWRGRLECIFSEYHFVSNTNTWGIGRYFTE
jgi:hypothetical protein